MTAAPQLSPAEASRERALPVLLVPAYEPPPLLPELLQGALATGRFSSAIVVDDGSSAACAPIFAACARGSSTVVLRQPARSGKGGALKVGLAAARARFPEAVGVVTADADGQHLPHDIGAVAAALAQGSGDRADLVLGVRRFEGAVPLRSRLGNALTRWVMRFVTGRRLTDTQTGLRGIPRGMIPQLLRLSSSGYAFELDMLLHCRGGRGIREVPIQTVYAAGNQTSHFDPIRDSMRIYWVLLRFFFASLVSAVIDNLVFAAAYLALPQLGACQLAARLVSMGVNFGLNRSAVFHDRRDVRRTLPRYLALSLLSGLLGYGLIRGLHGLGMRVLAAKVLAESLLFFLNFAVQRLIVFK
jgi:glycosyltransferase involved in cell wall biosynthesis